MIELKWRLRPCKQDMYGILMLSGAETLLPRNFGSAVKRRQGNHLPAPSFFRT